MKIVILGLLIVFALTIWSCEKDVTPQSETEAIEAYIASSGKAFTLTTDGYYYHLLEPGDGGMPLDTFKISVFYEGRLLDGVKFDGTIWGEPFTSKLTSLIRGWKLAIPKMRLHERALFIFPSRLGYGSAGSGRVPGNAPLVFDIELINFSRN